MFYYEIDMFYEDVQKVTNDLAEYRPDIIVAVARGGVTFGHFISEKMGVRHLYTINSIHYNGQEKLETIDLFNIPHIGKDKKVLVVDDIVDSGDSMLEVLDVLKKKYPNNTYKSAVLFYKKSACYRPDFYCREAKEWIEFFWSV